MPRSGPISLSLPAFSGVTRKLILANVAVFFALGLLGWLAPHVADFLLGHFMLEPRAVVRGEVWQLVTYAFVEPSILESSLECSRCGLQGRAAGAVVWWAVAWRIVFFFGDWWSCSASAISFTHVLGLRPDVAADGAWSGIFGLLIAIAMIFGDQEFLLWFLVRIKAKYMAIYIPIAVAVLLKQANSFGALLQLSGRLRVFVCEAALRRGLAFWGQ